MAELSTIARPYAEALFASARDDQAGLASWSDLVSELAQVAGQHDVREALSDPRLNAAQRIELFTGLIKSPLPASARNFIELLVSNNRILVLPQIAEQFEILKNQHEGTAAARIVSAFPLSDEQLQQLVAGLERKFGLKLKPVVTIDPDLIGGVRVAVGDQVLDASVQAQLARMRDTLAA
ncbi:F0F1 ATP synthase subunit delta [Parapusillimonas granuli]|uniref:ATP synthase subunit delta n=1 Tax=Parapusillimonas granuli TaxID=380911 RepID=A0A853FYL0_9BURK|nr:F0F1 ATP synthase subunit delta [Parapusillimonas granuli]MBB5215742.1 F-type H+-transporting ATPase subunit delta [Parapusillimonas granuli]MEB2399567.1 F0F1 ATP synthase subunit delta [Alcaligenaceae bacterium]NYT51194.1 F0F1 ATP synthase subunit delta [Parapusillimonas granuli]